MVKAFIVLGLGYGDEGKGLVTDYLCAHHENPLVIRFNGGQQAGHTVVTASGQRHVFSNFGSGTFRGAPTFWSAYCSFSPYHLMEEYERLRVPAKLFIDKNCSVTTHYDILFNQALEATRGEERYGSCGMGVGATMDRSKYLTLQVNDLLSELKFKAKLAAIKNYYRLKFDQETIYDFEQFSHEEQDEIFINEVQNMLRIVEITTAEKILNNNNWRTLIFEGAQGIMLDQTFGTQPYITKSNTTSKNALELLKQYTQGVFDTEIFYVTRCYATRHGAGPFSNSLDIPLLINSEQETNVNNPYQGPFRIANLDLERITYSLKTDKLFSAKLSKNLVITCLDQLTQTFDHEGLLSNVGAEFKQVFRSYGPTAQDIKRLFTDLDNI